jgi:hypothetical protein
MCVAWRCAQQLAANGYHGLGKWSEQTTWHAQFGPGRDEKGEDRDRWHEYFYTFNTDDDLASITTLWDIVGNTIRARYRRRVLVSGLLGAYEIDEDSHQPTRQLARHHHGVWRTVVTARESRNVTRGFVDQLQRWEKNYKDDFRLHGFYVFAQAPHTWRGWAKEGPRCVTEWQNGRRQP